MFYFLLSLQADLIISDGKIEDVIFCFEKLDNKEKKKCIDLLIKSVDL